MAIKISTKLPQRASIKQILKKCSNSFGRKDGYGHEGSLLDDVPRGHFVVYVGENRSRYIIPISWLDHPEFRVLLRWPKRSSGSDTIPTFESLVKKTFSDL